MQPHQSPVGLSTEVCVLQSWYSSGSCRIGDNRKYITTFPSQFSREIPRNNQNLFLFWTSIQNMFCVYYSPSLKKVLLYCINVSGNIVLLNYLIALCSSDINWVLCTVIMGFKGSPFLSTRDSNETKPPCVSLFTGAPCCSTSILLNFKWCNRWILMSDERNQEDSVMQAREYATGRIHETKFLRIYQSPVKTQAVGADQFFDISFL